MANKYACVFGGTGFIGNQVVRELAKTGYTVIVATRVPERAYDLKPCGVVGQIVPFHCDYDDLDSIRKAISGCDVVINLIGILFEKGKNTFVRAHVDIPRRIASACTEEKINRLVHVSALGVDQSGSQYAKTKREGEQAVLEAFSAATILRPSVVFGPGDNFFNMFASLACFLPVLPLIGGGKTKFQPVYAGDVADAVQAALTLPETGDHNPKGKIYELGGPDVVSFKDIYDRLFQETKTPRALIPIPWGVAKVQGAVFSLMPKPLLTADQVESLKTDNIVQNGALTLNDLGIQARAMDTVLSGYLARFRPGGRFANKKSA